MPEFSHSLKWLLIESHEGDKEPTRYWLSTLPEDTPSTFSSTRPNCVGASSATTRNSNANSASPISKDEGGAASIIAQPCRSRIRVTLRPANTGFMAFQAHGAAERGQDAILGSPPAWRYIQPRRPYPRR